MRLLLTLSLPIFLLLCTTANGSSDSLRVAQIEGNIAVLDLTKSDVAKAMELFLDDGTVIVDVGVSMLSNTTWFLLGWSNYGAVGFELVKHGSELWVSTSSTWHSCRSNNCRNCGITYFEDYSDFGCGCLTDGGGGAREELYCNHSVGTYSRSFVKVLERRDESSILQRGR